MATENKRYKHAQRDTQVGALAIAKAREVLIAKDTRKLVGVIEDSNSSQIKEGGASTWYAERWPNIDDIITDISSTDINLVISTTITLTQNTVIPSNVNLEFKKGGSIATAGFSLTINGTYSVGHNSAIFTGTGTVLALNNPIINVENFGAVGDGVTDDTKALNNVFDSIDTNGGIIIFPKTSNSYLVDTTSGNSLGTYTGTAAIYVKGNGAKLKQASTTSSYDFFKCRTNMTIEDLELEGYIDSGTGQNTIPNSAFGFRTENVGAEGIHFIRCNVHGFGRNGWLIQPNTVEGYVTLKDCIGYDNHNNDFASVSGRGVIIDGGTWGEDTVAIGGKNAAIDFEPENGQTQYWGEIKNCTIFHKVQMGFPPEEHTMHRGALRNIIFDGSIYDQGSGNYYSRCGWQTHALEEVIIENLRFINSAELQECNSAYFGPPYTDDANGFRHIQRGRFINLSKGQSNSVNLLPYTLAKFNKWDLTPTSGTGSITDEAFGGVSDGIRIKNTGAGTGAAYCKYSITGGYKVTMDPAGYVNAVAGDIGKNVIGSTTGAIGTLTAYDNGTRIWTITSLNYIGFGSGETITVGTSDYDLTINASGYTNAVATDIGKTVVGATSGAQGRLNSYDNGTRVWNITVTNGINFSGTEALSISAGDDGVAGTGAGNLVSSAVLTGTGSGVYNSKTLDTSWADDTQYSMGCTIKTFSDVPKYDVGMRVVLHGSLNEAGSLQAEQYLISTDKTNVVEKVNCSFWMPDGCVGIDIYIGSTTSTYAFDHTFSDFYLCRDLVDNEQAATYSRPIDTQLPATLSGGLAVDTPLGDADGPIISFGSGSPEGVKTAKVGSIYHRTDASDPSSIYIKESGAGNTGWISLYRDNKGDDVASANDVTLGKGSYFDITGTTQINTITLSGLLGGKIITLQFDASVTVKHNTAGSGSRILLAGSVDFSATTNDTLTLVYDGVTWREIGRAVI